jgi:tetratricopeptide (TPR) repeat protein
MVTVWSGREAHALREALRMSLDDFAAHLSVSRRAVARWNAVPGVRLRWDIQRALDRALAAAPPEARQRMRALLAASREENPGRPGAAAEAAAPRDVAQPPPTSRGNTRPHPMRDNQPAQRQAAQGQPAQGKTAMARRLGAVLVPAPRASGAAPPALFRLERAVALARLGFQVCRYEETAQQLPALAQALAEARADSAARFPERVPRLACASHQVTASLLLKVGDLPLALLAAERAVRDANDALTTAASARTLAEVLTRCGHPERALALECDVDGKGPREVSVRGSLLLAQALAAAHAGDPAEAARLLDRADREAKALGAEGNFAWTGFGPANAGLHRAMALRLLGEEREASRQLSKVDPARLAYPERREAYFFEVSFLRTSFLGASTPASSRC